LQTALNTPPRLALFPDTFHETNGVATLSRHLAEFAKERDLPLLLVRGSNKTAFSQDGSVETLELKRGPASFTLDKGLYCDPLLTRHQKLVSQHLLRFKPDLLQITGPGDLGFMGLLVSHNLHIPLVSSWHTNLHEYLSRRIDRALHLVPKRLRHLTTAHVEKQSLRGLLRFYQTARFVFAPNQETVDMLHRRTGRPAFLMPHGVDLNGYRPAVRSAHDKGPFCIGYVGRLTIEKNIRSLVDVDRRLTAMGETNYKFLIVGEGGQQSWLRKHLPHADFPGPLRREQLAAAYRRMDAFVFPSTTDTFGLVILEAMASGIPVILPHDTGARVGAQDNVSALFSTDFAASIKRLMHDDELRCWLSVEARKLAAGHSWDSVFEKLYSTYEEGLAIIQDGRREEREALVSL
jgi:phosphatidylinositol alpha 1,6-mannosyltransferase